jgi:bla regulator protein BlaR1
MNSSLVMALGDHLWQSTLFAGAVGCLTLLLHRNSARVRCCLWLAASIKFLVPFALLTAMGTRIPLPSAPLHGPTPVLLSVVGQKAVQITQVATAGVTALARVTQTVSGGGAWLVAIEVLWTLGTLLVALHWLSRWRLIRRVLNDSAHTNMKFVIPVRSSAAQLEPAVVGILNPVLLIPKDIELRLAPEEMGAVLTHEGCHVAWRDNLLATLHGIVEMLFWFNPIVWWIGTRIVDERERACDEHVLAHGHLPQSYGEGILKVCEHYLQSPLTCAAGVGGANLRQRIETIMQNRLIEQLGAFRKVVLTAAACATIVVPLGCGVLTSHGRAEAATAEVDSPVLRNVSIRLAPPLVPGQLTPPGLYNSFGLLGPDGMTVQAVYPSLRGLVAAAYGVDPSQVVGRDLSQEPMYQITADNPWPESPTDSGGTRAARYLTSTSEVAALQRQLLTTHFGLVVKRERRQMAGYVLTIGSGGSKLTPDSDAPWWKQGAGQSNHEIITTKTPVDFLLHFLQAMLQAPVVDQTGLTGTYDYKLTWNPSAAGQRPEPATIAKALEEQLGLHLEARTVTVDVINVVSLKSAEQILTSR